MPEYDPDISMSVLSDDVSGRYEKPKNAIEEIQFRIDRILMYLESDELVVRRTIIRDLEKVQDILEKLNYE